MAQQQLLLLILVLLITSFTIVVAVNIFGERVAQSNRDAVRQDLLSGATSAQVVYTRPANIGGAGEDFTRVEDDLLPRLLAPITEIEPGVWGNENGIYEIVDVEESSFSIRGIPSGSDPALVLTVRFLEDNHEWIVSIADQDEES
ncbi:hypothetical protein [Natronogracilivirga saccharolytica]|uniref:Uncharacterized protein n=1 Tax=Natronogracilivirga saccharolytica TaxID=2812953 RepID=A0A8J7RLJ2_9BACT|nr:hypothetical protein [Natronogracilivirga saccharolytica]MBP3191899.1 hypothetical protein [Natronogracilivirga saccharolytica]